MRQSRSAAPPSPSAVGALLQYWRKARSLSQLALAAEADVSPRHLCFVETGRATPSRDMVLLLTEALRVPLRERNALLLAAGYAADLRRLLSVRRRDDRGGADVRVRSAARRAFSSHTYLTRN